MFILNRFLLDFSHFYKVAQYSVIARSAAFSGRHCEERSFFRPSLRGAQLFQAIIARSAAFSGRHCEERSFFRPSLRGAQLFQAVIARSAATKQSSGLSVIARSVATKQSSGLIRYSERSLDCFTAFAMTNIRLSLFYLYIW